MWIFLSNSFLSIVAHRTSPDLLLVRARLKGDIERALPGAKVWTDNTADYKYRAEISREEVAKAVAAHVSGIEYDNFKASTPYGRHNHLMDIWEIMRQVQDRE